ncbi:hypothetical protein Asfd1_142 [Aeromonas phage Asfd_1]|nr:hypothetical protein Asfd1_142 [Aeromonas phage Asfd_1]
MEHVKYRFKEYSHISDFVHKDNVNLAIYRDLHDKEFYLKQVEVDKYVAVDAIGDRMYDENIFDFNKTEVDEFLEIVDELAAKPVEKPAEEPVEKPLTISQLHDWSIRHALTSLSVEKVVEMYKIYIK